MKLKLFTTEWGPENKWGRKKRTYIIALSQEDVWKALWEKNSFEPVDFGLPANHKWEKLNNSHWVLTWDEEGYLHREKAKEVCREFARGYFMGDLP